jgi:hypothetical protein
MISQMNYIVHVKDKSAINGASDTHLTACLLPALCRGP